VWSIPIPNRFMNRQTTTAVTQQLAQRNRPISRNKRTTMAAGSEI
jgi:hypothetical protein